MFGDEVTRTAIMNTNERRRHKTLGDAIKGLDEAIWQAVTHHFIIPYHYFGTGKGNDMHMGLYAFSYSDAVISCIKVICRNFVILSYVHYY